MLFLLTNFLKKIIGTGCTLFEILFNEKECNSRFKLTTEALSKCAGIDE